LGALRTSLAKGKTHRRCWVHVRDDRPFGGPDPPAAMFSIDLRQIIADQSAAGNTPSRVKTPE
jgi:hypothetical protein